MDWQLLDSLIDQLELFLMGSPRLVPIDWRRVWSTAKAIQDGFKGVRYPTRGEREAAWRRFTDLRDEAKRRSSENREDRRGRSERLKWDILSLVESARPNDLFGFSPVNVEAMKAYGRKLKEAGQMLSEHKSEMFGEDKEACFAEIQAMREIHDAWWENLRGERRQRAEERRERILGNLEKNRERYRKTADALERCRDRADDLRSKIATAWNDDWSSRATDRLAEAEDKIRDMEDSLRQLERWIEEDENKL